MSASGQLTVCGTRFALRQGSISAWMNDPYWVQTYAPNYPLKPRWCLDLYFENGEIGGEVYAPRVYHESMPLNLASWRQLAGLTYEWSESSDADGQANGGFYLLEHGSIFEARLRISSMGGARFRVEWSGVCETILEEPTPSEANFSLFVEVEFTGIAMATSEHETESQAHERFARHCELSDFIPDTPIWQGQYQSGVQVGQIFFRPRLVEEALHA